MEQNFEDWIGRSVTRMDVVTERLLAEYRATLSPHLFETSEYVCPPGFHFGLAPTMPSMQGTGPDGAERKGLFLPPIELPRRMWAGGSIETIRPLRLGDKVRRHSRIADIRFKRGSSGELCLVSIMHEISDQDGLAIRERQDLVFREAASESSPPAEAAEDGSIAAEMTVEASALLLFRFSAFTFNGHRIHYDLAHAAAEGYPNLLVHGPLQAALMLNLAARRLGGTPRQFVYRCLAPLYGGSRFGVRFDAEAARARIIRSDGFTAAEGQAPARGTG
jgi:3-methylfumaryl-CoA hydratase